MSISLIIFFEDPWWVGLFTVKDDNSTRYCRVVFGKEPLDSEVYGYVQKRFNFLEFTDSVPANAEKPPVANPKRRQRQISREIHQKISTKASYETIKQTITQNKKKLKREEKRKRASVESTLKFQIRRNKHRDKHKGH